MCGAYGFSVKDAKEVSNRFELANALESFTPRWNIRPGQMNPVIVGQERNEIALMFWGLIPHFAADEHYKYKTINAKAETVATLPSFREPFRRKRCLVPATGFYEPDKLHFAKPPYPWHYFQLKDHALFAFAGLYDVWKDPTRNKDIHSYTIITTVPNALVGKFHDRMPVILHKEDEHTWLDPTIVEPERLRPLLQPFPADTMEEWAVGSAARNVRNEGPALIQPVP